MAKITIWGAENYLNSLGTSLFANMALPDELDRETCINAIMTRCNEFELMYSDLDFMKSQIKQWADRWQLTFEKWVEGFAAEFSPIDNYDRYEEFSENRGRELKTTYGKKSTETHDVSAYDSTGYTPKDKMVTDWSNSDTDNEKENSKHNSRIHGNIGVTTSTDVLTKYTDFYKNYNIYELIADCFCTEFCIMVY